MIEEETDKTISEKPYESLVVEGAPKTLTERMAILDNEISSYDGPRSRQELDRRIEDIRQQYFSATESTDISEESRGLLAKKMQEEIKGAEAQMDSFKTKQQEVHLLEAEDIIAYLESLGAKINDEAKAKAIKLLSSSEILDLKREDLAELLGIDKNDPELVKRLSVGYRTFSDKYSRILRDQLVEKDSEIFFGADVRVVGHQEVHVDDETIDMAELSDPEIRDLGEEEIKKIIEGILSDKEVSAGQGMFWNVLVPGDLPYVLKTQRKREDPLEIRYGWEAILRYPIIRDCIGKEFLPRQAVLQTDSGQLHILQEKMPLAEMTSVTSKNIGAMINGEYGQEVSNALKEERNKEKLRDFISKIEKLYEEHKLMIDIEGDNLFFSISKDGELDIKLVDYGTSKQWEDEEPSTHIKEALEFIAKLKNNYLQ